MPRHFSDLSDALRTPACGWHGLCEDREWRVGSTNQFIEEKRLEWARGDISIVRCGVNPL